MKPENIPENSAGIYRIKNIKNGKYYIGSSVDLKDRLKDHEKNLNKNQHKNKKLQKDWNKHGSKNFKFDILVYCNDMTIYKNDLFYLEQRAIDQYKANYKKYGYNVVNTNQRIDNKKIDKNKFKKRKSKLTKLFNKK